MNRLSPSLNPALATLRTTLRTSRSLSSRGRNRRTRRHGEQDDDDDDDGPEPEEQDEMQQRRHQPPQEDVGSVSRQGSDAERTEPGTSLEGASPGGAGEIPNPKNYEPSAAAAVASCEGATSHIRQDDLPTDRSGKSSNINIEGSRAHKLSSDADRARGRSRSRVRRFLERGGLMKKDQGTEESGDRSDKGGDDERRSTREEGTAIRTLGPHQPTRGRSRSRVVQRILLSRRTSVGGGAVDDADAAVPSPVATNAAGKERPAPPRRTKSSGARSVFSILTSSRSLAGEANPPGESSATPGRSNRPQSTSRKSQPKEEQLNPVSRQLPNHLPIRSDVIVETPESRKVMRNISRLGMEDPVLRRKRLDELNGATSTAAAAAAAPTPAGSSGTERHLPPTNNPNDPSAAASFSERMSQQYDDLVGKRDAKSGGLPPKKLTTTAMVVDPSSVCLDDNDDTDRDGFDDGLSVRSDPTATSQNDGIDMVKFRRALHRTPSTSGKGRTDGIGGDGANDFGATDAEPPRNVTNPRSPSKRSVREEIQVSPQRRRGTVKGLKLEDFQAALERHQQQQQLHIPNVFVSAGTNISKDKDLVGGADNDDNDVEDDDDDNSNPLASTRESSSGLVPPYMLNGGGGGLAAAPYSPKTPKFDSLGSSSSWHSRASSRRTPTSDRSRTSIHSSKLPAAPLDSESMHSQSTVAASTSTVEVCNSSSRLRQNHQRREQQKNQPQHPTSLYNMIGDKDYRLSADLLDLYPPGSAGPASPPYLIRAASGPGTAAAPAAAQPPVPTLSRRHSITTSAAASSALSPASGHGSQNRVVVKVRVKKRTSLSHAPSPLSPSGVGAGTNSLHLLPASSSSKSSKVKPPFATTHGGGICAAGSSSSSPWQAPFAPTPMEPTIRRPSSLKQTPGSASCHSQHFDKADPSSHLPPPVVLTSSLRRKKTATATSAAVDALPSKASSTRVDTAAPTAGLAGSSTLLSALTAAAALDPWEDSSPLTPSSTPLTPSSSSSRAAAAAAAAQEMMSHQRVLPADMETIFA